MKQIGTVELFEDNKAVVKVVRQGACGDHCSMCGACHVEPMLVEADCFLSVSVGDRVEMESDSKAVIAGLIVLFILPIVLPILSYVIVKNLLGSVAAWSVCVVMFVASCAIVFALNRSEKYLNGAKAKVIRRIST